MNTRWAAPRVEGDCIMSWRTIFSSLCLVVAAVLPITAAQGAGTLYRWVDSHGEVHYGDSVPARDAGKGRDLLNQQGMVVKQVAPAKTKAQIAAEERQAKLRAEQKRKAAAQAARDKALLNAYSDEQDIIDTRDAKLDAIDNLIKISVENIDQLKQRLSSLIKNAANRERSGRAVPRYLVQRMDNVRAQIKGLRTYIANERSDQESIRNKYQKDIQRFRELTARRDQ